MKRNISIYCVAGCLLFGAYLIFSGFIKAKSTSQEMEVKARFKGLIDAENKHDLNAVKTFIWDSENALFISKTKSMEDGGWGAYWGTANIMTHFGDLYKGIFRIDPVYSRQRVVFLNPTVAQVYVPAKFTVSYGGNVPKPVPFLMVTLWVKSGKDWKMSTDIPLPVPQSPISK
ncbi:hypothetical protein [Pedobacter aquatilis]|uniref:hypothetical protein n=1 Tax=Pedobacter aquatilis TaxID=351343 RepID=UPI00292EB913|nr:hypothetical protein [Pedobacter aquatilis]